MIVDGAFRRGCTRGDFAWTTDDDCTPLYAGDIYPHILAQIHTHGRNFARTYVQHIRQGVEIIKGAWRARGCPDDGHVNQDGR